MRAQRQRHPRSVESQDARGAKAHEFAASRVRRQRDCAAIFSRGCWRSSTGLDYFDNAIFSFFASYIAGGVNASPDELVWSSSAYAVAAVLGILQQQWWVERLGHRRYIAGCLLLYAAGAVDVGA